MREIVSQIWKSNSARNVGKLLSANVIAQAIGLLVYPILTRMYAPEDFGLLNLFLSIGGVLVIPATMQYQFAIPVASKEQEAKGAFHAGMICLAGGTLLLALLPFFATPIARLSGAPDLADYLWLMPIYVFSAGLWQLISNWYIRRKAFGHISRYQIVQNVLSAGSKIGLGYWVVPGGLLYGGVGALAVAGIGSFILGWKKQVSSLYLCKKEEIRNAFRRFRNYPRYTMPSAMVNTVNCNIAVWMITPFFGLEKTGFWGMAMLLAFTPISLIAVSIHQVLLSDVSAKVNTGQSVGRSFIQYMKKAAWAVIPFFVLLFVAMPWLVKVLLGDGWEETAYMIRCFLPWFALYCFAIPWNFLPNLFEKQHINLWMEAVMLLSRLVVIGVGCYLHNLAVVVMAYSAVSAAVVLIQLVWYTRLVQQHDKNCQSPEDRGS